MRNAILIDWTASVAIKLDTEEFPCFVGSTREAAALLIEHWPVQRGHAFLLALKLCAEALEEEASPDQARRAFLAAAQEANVILTLH